MKRNELEIYLRKLLNSDNIPDDSLNGLQVEGREDVEKIALAVSSSIEAFEIAHKNKCDAIIVHHGLFWKNKEIEPITQALKKRLGLLLKYDINLFAFHLPLDAHPQIGNNARAAIDLHLGNIKPFCQYKGTLIGYKGSFLEPAPLKEFIKKVEEYYNHKALLLPFGKKIIKNVGIVSGGASMEVKQAAKEGLDLFITGEATESSYYIAKELEINMACFGHYATERVGIKALAEHLKSVLNKETLIIELKNPL